MTLSPSLTAPVGGTRAFAGVRKRSNGGQQKSAVELYLQLCRFADTAIALSALIGLFVVANLGRLPTGLDDFLSTRLSVKNCLLVVIFAASWYLSCRWAGLYDWDRVKNHGSEVVRICGAASVGTLTALIFPLTSESGAFQIELLLPFLGLGAAVMLVARAALRSTSRASVRTSRTLLIVGAGPRAQELYSRIKSEGNGEVNMVGFVDSAMQPELSTITPVCSLDELERFLMGQELDEVLIALPVKSRYAEIQRAIQICERVGVPIKYPASAFTHARIDPRVEHSTSGPVLSVPAAVDGPRLLVKRAMDIAGATLGLLLLLPVLVAVALTVKLTSPGPVLFSQLRYGRYRRRFRMYKFRTMAEGAEAQLPQLEGLNEAQGPVFKIRRDPRLTPVGAFLRRTSWMSSPSSGTFSGEICHWLVPDPCRFGTSICSTMPG